MVLANDRGWRITEQRKGDAQVRRRFRGGRLWVNAHSKDNDAGFLVLRKVLLQLTELLTAATSKITHIKGE